MPDEIAALCGREETECGGDQIADVVEGPGTCRPDECFQFREGQFDRIEIRAVGREKAQLGTDSFDGGAHRRLFVDGEVIEHNDVTRAQRGHEDLLDISQKRHVVDRPIEHRGSAEALEAERRDDGVGLPVAERRVISQARSARTAPIPPQQIGRHAAFIQEDVLAHVAQRLPRPPLPPGRGDVRPALLVGVYRFF